MGAGANGRWTRQGLRAGEGDAVGELFHFLLVDIGPHLGQGPRAVETDIRSAVEGVNVAFQAAEHIRPCVIRSGAILARFPKGPAVHVIIKLIEQHLLEPVRIGAGQDPPLPAVNGGFPSGVIIEGVIGDGKGIQAGSSIGSGVFTVPLGPSAWLGQGNVPSHDNGNFDGLSRGKGHFEGDTPDRIVPHRIVQKTRRIKRRL